METALELRRWQEKPLGVGYRRWVIVSNGLRQMFRLRVFKILLVLAWTAGVLIAAAGFLFTQSLASGGWFESWAASLGPRVQAVVSAFCSVVLLYPDICVHGLFTAVFWWHSFVGLGLCLVALSVAVPRLVALDRSCNALTIYLSRPLTSIDYLVGKLGIVAGILLLLWTGPLLLGWVLSMAFATNSDFFVYSLTALMRACLFNLISLVVVAAVALAVSSLGKTTRTVTAVWIGVWIVAGSIAQAPLMPAIVQGASFSRNLAAVRQELFEFDAVLLKAADTLPIANDSFANSLRKGASKVSAQNTRGAHVGLIVITIVCSLVFSRKLRPE